MLSLYNLAMIFFFQNFTGDSNKTSLYPRYRYIHVRTNQVLMYKGNIHSFHIPEIHPLLFLPLILDKTLEFLHLLSQFDRHLHWKRYIKRLFVDRTSALLKLFQKYAAWKTDMALLQQTHNLNLRRICVLL